MIQIVKNPDDKRKFQTFNNRKNSSFNENTELNAIPHLTTPELVQPECSRTERPTSIVKERSTLKKGRSVPSKDDDAPRLYLQFSQTLDSSKKRTSSENWTAFIKTQQNKVPRRTFADYETSPYMTRCTLL